ncbi:MAG: PAS domain-containing sensor histidine kinase [Bradyrhizobium sp.]|nr:MAG: PAS domain-containing sensor histidine kinase [Bradyrhizobium sp.]
MNPNSPLPAIDRVDRAANPAMLLALALILCGAVAAFLLLPAELGLKAISATIALLAAFGVFSILLYAFGQLQFAGRAGRFDITKAIADGNSDGLIVTDADSRIVYANDAYRLLSGAETAGDLKLVERLFTGAPEVSEAVYRLAQAARAGHRAVEELRMAPPLAGEGAAAWYRIRVRPLEGIARRGATAWTVSDITRERERHESFFQDLQHAIDYLDHAPAGFFSAEPDGSIAYINATLANWLDYDIAQFAAGQLKLADVVAADGAALLSIVSGRPGEVTTERFDVDLKRRQGQFLPVRLLHRVAFSSAGLPGASRTLVLNRAPGEDAGEDLRAAEVRFARFFNSTPMAIASIGADGAVLRANGAFVRLAPSALKPGAPQARPSLYAGVVERDHDALADAIAAASGGKGDIAPLDVALEGEPPRSARFFLSAADPHGDEGASALVFALDTTEQRALQESFVQSQKMQAIGQLAGGIAHDFNNVLTAIIGYSDLLLGNHRATDPSFQDIMQIKQNANRAAGLVRQLLAFSRRQTLRPQTLQLGEVLSELQMLLRRLVGETIELELVHGRDLWLVKADLNQFEQVVVNLVVNARDAMKDGGKIVLRTRNVPAAECAQFNEKSLVAADYVLVEVEDEGHGIPAAVRGKIFEPFFTTKEVGKGTGLGLSMVYGIVKQTGGYVFCESEEGVGATFRVLLPRFIAEAVAEPVKKEAPKPTADLTGRGAILLVEDEEAVRAFASRALASRGYTVLEAENGADALRVVEANGGAIDLIVSDVIMPEMDGATMFTELRRRGLNAKIIFVSGYADDAFARNLPEGQEFLFLPKPFTLKQLVETVKSAMS